MIDPEILRTLLYYDLTTGKLYWRYRTSDMCSNSGNGAAANAARWNACFGGSEAFTGQNDKGYHTGSIYGKTYRASRVIWALFFGEWPDQVDHINGDKTDNRIINLRKVSHAMNQRNQGRYRNNTTGATGVLLRENRWLAQIKVSGKMKHLGSFDSFEQAATARKEAELQYGFHPNHGREALKTEPKP
jgi:hypothetical protein